jgi:hypothetical protein
MSELFEFYFDVRSLARLPEAEGQAITNELDEWYSERNVLGENLPSPYSHLVYFVVEGVVGAVEFKLRMSEWLVENPFLKKAVEPEPYWNDGRYPGVVSY